MELNREQIIKALECWAKNFDGKVTDFKTLCEATLLIKKLIAENESLIEGVEIKVLPASELLRIMELEKQVEGLTEENERLRAEVSVKKKLLDKGVDLDDKVKADTVRKMQKRFAQAICDNTYPDFDKAGKPINVWKATTGYDVLDQIAKEMLEDL